MYRLQDFAERMRLGSAVHCKQIMNLQAGPGPEIKSVTRRMDSCMPTTFLPAFPHVLRDRAGLRARASLQISSP